ncbi:MAG: hypothetical protein LBO02_00365 [Holosporaceae bacterium]|nr:hypothetical protein [Holosporaceae bacterium]
MDCFFIKNVEDQHLEKISKFFNEKNSVFVLESGNYIKSKKITDYFLKSEAISVASFANDATLHSLCRMIFPNISQIACDEIVKIIDNTDEELYSVFLKISLLLDGRNWEDLKSYAVHKRSLLGGLDLIPLIRFLLQTVMRERILKSANFSKISIGNRDAIHHLLNAELMQKFGSEISKSYVYHKLITDQN